MQTLVADQLWTDAQPLRVLGLPLGRRLGVARNATGGLVVFSPLKGSAAAIRALRELGDVQSFVVPSRFHDLFFPDYFAAFPKAAFLAGETVCRDHRTWPLTPLTANHPALAGFRFVRIEGMPQVQEHVFLHEVTRTLIVADLFFNLPIAADPLTRFWMRLADMGGRPRPSRLFRSAIRDPAAFAASLQEVLTWPFDQILTGHGEWVATQGPQVLREAFAPWITAHPRS